MSAMTAQWYEIGVLDYARAKPKKWTYIPPGNSTVVFDGSYSLVEDGRCFKESGITRISSEAKLKGKIDVTTGIPLRVIFRRAKSHNLAIKMGRKIGSVQFCRKVNASYRVKSIEYIELNQKPLTVEIVEDDKFVLNAKGELTLAQQGTKKLLEKKYEIQIDLNK